MKPYTFKIYRALFALVITFGLFADPKTARAAAYDNTLTFALQEVGSGVQISVSGNVSPSLWTLPQNEGISTANTLELRSKTSFRGNALLIFNGPATISRTLYRPAGGVTILGPDNFGISTSYQSLVPSSYSGATAVGFQTGTVANSFLYLYVPVGAILGTTSLNATITVPSTSFSSMGLTSGSSYIWTFSNGSTTDSLQVNIVSASPVPEAGGSVAGLGLAMAGLYQLRRRRQNTDGGGS